MRQNAASFEPIGAFDGATENARTENATRSKMQGWKRVTGKAGTRLADRGGNRETGKRGTSVSGVENAGLISTERRTCMTRW